jgi:hypothetical protein
MTRLSFLLLLATLLVVTFPASAEKTARSPDFELRTWAVTAAAPANGEPLSESASFVMRSRLGGPFVGHAESASFALWGCGVVGLNVYRATSEEGPYDRINPEPLPPDPSGAYEDADVWPGYDYWYALRAVMPDGSEEPLGGGPYPVTTEGALFTCLRAVSPNPFRTAATILHETARTALRTRIAVYDVSGKVVRVLVDGPARAGRHEITWDGTNENGQRVASGVYFFALESGDVRERRSVVLLR